MNRIETDRTVIAKIPQTKAMNIYVFILYGSDFTCCFPFNSEEKLNETLLIFCILVGLLKEAIGAENGAGFS